MMIAWTYGLVLTALLVSVLASAEEAAPVHVTKETVVVGRRQLPKITIEVTRPTATREAETAHESLRRALAIQHLPAALR